MDYSEDEKMLVDYLDGNLEADAVRALEYRLMQDKLLKQKLMLVEWSRKAIKLTALQGLIAQRQQGFLKARKAADYQQDHTISGRFTFSPAAWVGIAASLLVLIGLGLVLFLNSLSGSDLYENKFLAYEVSSFRADNAEDSPIKEAFRQGKYAQILGASADTVQPEALAKDDLLLLGIASLEVGEPNKALIYLDILQQKNEADKSGELQDEGDFYSALAYVKLEKYALASARIAHISNTPNHKYTKNFPWAYRVKIKLLSLLS
ncbi:MAG: hypothetical protein GC137_05540 [Alphaproteobacteria bacterium]|nr:hypothetical protein [Alphaproteobacteria bacterium]